MLDDPSPHHPSLHFEREAWNADYRTVAGVDEAGRGPLAGPVVVAAVILNADSIPVGLNDSKKLSEKRRNMLFDAICQTASLSIVSSSPERIDRLNIREATLRAMAEAIAGLSAKADFALIDGRDLPEGLPCPGKSIIKGDARSLSIAAASIIAKVTRDRMMVAAATTLPGYGFERHKGYGSAFHRDQIKVIGPSPLHRRSFEPIKSMVVTANHQDEDT
ncbi:MAG: ribonuclease HII [Pseudomonadota bacterium]